MASNLLESELLPVSIASGPLVGAAPDSAPFPIRKFSVQEYQLIGQRGILDDDNVELLEGWIVSKMTKYPQHTLATQKLLRAIEGRLPPGFHLRNQEPIVTTDSCPEPDLAIVRGRPEDYSERHPISADVILVIEIADSTLAKDRRKCTTYARGRITQYWIVNLTNRCLEVYSDPTEVEPAQFQKAEVLTPDAMATIPFSDSVVVSVPVCEFLTAQ